MESRKSLMHKRLESLQNSPTSSSPLRRKSIIQNSAVGSALSENDDEAERIARRREILTTSASSPPSTNSKRFSLGLGFLANIPAPQMAESINECIKLSAENKINIKNAFSLEMIDFMTYMIKKQDVNMSNLQVASTSLDVSTKIYGYRVDSVHMEILKMVGGLDKQDNTEEEEGTEASVESNDGQKKKKKKRARQKILNTVEALRSNIEISKPMLAMIGEGDLQTSDMLYQTTLPNHANSGFYLHLYNDVLVDTLEDMPESRINSNAKYTVPAIEDFLNLEICPSYSNFEFLGWSVDNEPEDMSEEEADSADDSGNHFQFDLDANVEQDDDPAPEPMNYFDIEHNDNNDNNENFLACHRQTANNDANIVDIPNARLPEYSFIQPSCTLHWAGPSHWKFRRFSKFPAAAESSSNEVACMQAKQRTKKHFELSYDEPRDNIDTKFASSQSIKLQAKTAKAEWSAEILTLPEDVHYDTTQLNKLYHYKKAIKLTNSEDEEDRDAAAADVFDGENYDYNNPNDTLEYCPNVEHDDDYNDENRDDGNNDCHFDENAVAFGTQGLTGDNLVAAPKLINKIPITYCLKAKRIDMRQLKKSIWSCLKSSDNAAATNSGETVNESDDMMKDSKQFSDVYKELPKLLSRNNTEALSVPISFISLLHLANEKGLKIRSVPDMSDLIIEPGDLSESS